MGHPGRDASERGEALIAGQRRLERALAITGLGEVRGHRLQARGDLAELAGARARHRRAKIPFKPHQRRAQIGRAATEREHRVGRDADERQRRDREEHDLHRPRADLAPALGADAGDEPGRDLVARGDRREDRQIARVHDAGLRGVSRLCFAANALDGLA